VSVFVAFERSAYAGTKGEMTADPPRIPCAAVHCKGARSTAGRIVVRPECRYQALRLGAPLRGCGA
jgi:hypothetical protein